MLFSKKWLKNHPQFLLHFLIHIDVLILCRKFELIVILVTYFHLIHVCHMYDNNFGRFQLRVTSLSNK